MREPIDNLYFNWLCAKVITVEVPTPSTTYWKLLRKLFDTEFVWLLSGDDNRAEDGIELRKEFLRAANEKADDSWNNLGCSIFEMLIAFSRVLEFETDDPASQWFWVFLENLGIADLNDAADLEMANVDEILRKFVWRIYNEDGSGGLFPLKYPNRDQLKVEIWYQFCDYLIDLESD